MDKLDMLLKKVEHEYEEYKKVLLSSSPNTVFDMSYETAIKTEIKSLLADGDILYNKDIDTLLSVDNTLDYLYQLYLDDDTANINCELKYLYESCL